MTTAKTETVAGELDSAGPAKKVSTQITEFRPFEAKLAEFKKRYVGVVYDLSDPEQDKAARSDQRAIGKVVAELDRKHKELKEPLAKRVAIIDGERKRIKDDLRGVQDEIKSQIEAHEQAIAQRAAELEARVQAIRALAEQTEGLDSNALTERLQKAEAVEIDDSFAERKGDAALAIMDTTTALKKLIESRKEQEAKDAELAELRRQVEKKEQAEREEKIRREAAEAEQRRIADAQEQAAQQERKRQENAKHRQKIHREAKAGLVKAGFTEKQATKIVTLVKDGKIAHISIRY